MAELKSWGFLIPLISVGFGWLLHELTQLFRVRGNDRKTLNRILYNLILTYDLLIKLNKPNLDRGLKKLYSKIQQLNEFDINDDIVSIITRCLISVQIKSIFEKDIVTIKNNFAIAMEELAKIFPLTAYELNNSASIKSTFENLENMILAFGKKFAIDVPKEEEFTKFLELMKPALIENSVKSIEKDILYISSKIGLITRYKTSRIIELLNKDFSEETIEKAAKALEKVLIQLI
ncbi:MAG: hypothetical protein ABI203_11265 [Mucilaginibacter sp.]